MTEVKKNDFDTIVNNPNKLQKALNEFIESLKKRNKEFAESS